jgi:hypothetical protein
MLPPSWDRELQWVYDHLSPERLETRILTYATRLDRSELSAELRRYCRWQLECCIRVALARRD